MRAGKLLQRSRGMSLIMRYLCNVLYLFCTIENFRDFLTNLEHCMTEPCPQMTIFHATIETNLGAGILM